MTQETPIPSGQRHGHCLHMTAKEGTRDLWHICLKSRPPLNDLIIKQPVESTQRTHMSLEMSLALLPSNIPRQRRLGQECCLVFRWKLSHKF